jgi:hypothetical protein
MYVYQRSPSIKINFDITFRDKDFFLELFPTQIYATNSTLYKIFQEKKNKMKNEKKKKKKEKKKKKKKKIPHCRNSSNIQ